MGQYNEFDSPPSRPPEQDTSKTMRSCSNAQARLCSNSIQSTTVKRRVAAHVATPTHTQDTQEYLMDNHRNEEPNQTHWNTLEIRFVLLPPSAPRVTALVSDDV